MTEYVTVWVDDLPDLKRGEEIVRCRDCKHYEDGMINGRRYSEPYCGAIGELSFGALFEVTKDDFCSWGERKNDAHAERLRGEGGRE